MRLPVGPYDVILADPPWPNTDYAAPIGEVHQRARGANRHYPSMRLAGWGCVGG